jgi:hypothetical protein
MLKCDMLVCIMSAKTFLDVGKSENVVYHNIGLEVAWHTKHWGEARANGLGCTTSS